MHRDGTITNCPKPNINIFKTWYDYTKKYLPKGSMTIQSTTSHCWPYPALLYKRGTWPCIDLFFLLPDIPLTFIGETEGQAFR